MYLEWGVEPAIPTSMDLLRTLKATLNHTHSELSKAESLAADRIAELEDCRTGTTSTYEYEYS